MSGPQKPGPIAAPDMSPGLTVRSRLSGPQKPGPIAAVATRSISSRKSVVVRASETRPNCSRAPASPPRASTSRCPGLRSPAQLQLKNRALLALEPIGCPGLRNPAQLQQELAAGMSPDQLRVVRASETRPNCSLAGLEVHPGPELGCPGLRNPAQLQLRRSRSGWRPGVPLSGPQKPGPIAAIPRRRARQSGK